MQSRKKISILSMNMSSNCTNRCYKIAQALSPEYEVEILGPMFGVGDRWGEGIWPPLEGSKIPLNPVRGDYFPGFLQSIWQLLKRTNGDVIIACKPRFPSFGVALLKRLFSGKPVILDVDDDELAQTMPGKKAKLIKKLINPSGYLFTRLIHPLHRWANAVFVVSDHFKKTYGGTIVPHGQDPAELDPARYNATEIKQALGAAEDEILLAFVGTPQYQKGIDLILDAIVRVNNPRLKLMIIGADPSDSYTAELGAQYGSKLLLIPPQPVTKIPYFLAAADIVPLPQRAVAESRGQMPAKLTDAMAMGKIVIASNISDIPKYLEGRGLIVEPGNAEDLAEKIRWTVDHPEEAKSLGCKARAYFLEHLSLQSMLAAMKPEIERVTAKMR